MQNPAHPARPPQLHKLCAALLALGAATPALAQLSDGPVRGGPLPPVGVVLPAVSLGPQDLVLRQVGADDSIIKADQNRPEEGSAKLNAYVLQSADHSLVDLIQEATAATALVQQAGQGYEVRLEQRGGLLNSFPSSTPATTLLNQVGSTAILNPLGGLVGRNLGIVTQGVAAVFEEAPTGATPDGLAPRESGFVSLRQTGERNRARVNQLADGASTVTINQTNGSVNHALYVEQSGFNNKFSAFLDGAEGGSMKMRQSGINNVARLDSQNENNKMDVRQSGADSLMELSQLAFADVSSMTVNHDCIGFCSLDAEQAGNSDLNAVQLGSLNVSIDVRQFANGGFMDVRQIGASDSSITATQR